MSQNLSSAAVVISALRVKNSFFYISTKTYVVGTQKNLCFIEFGEFSGRGPWFEPYWRHCVVSLSKTLDLQCLVLVQPRETSQHDQKIVGWNIRHLLKTNY